LEEDRDRIAVLNIEKRALEQLEPISGGPLTAPTAPQMTDVAPNRCGEPNRPFRAGRRSGGVWNSQRTEAKTLLEETASKFRDQKFLAYSAMAIWKLGGEVSWILERISKVQIYDGKDFVELDGRGLRELIERELFYP